VIRPAVPEDVDSLVQMIHDLAEYEHSADSVEIDHARLETALFGDSPSVFAHVAEEGGRILGMAIWFKSFSTWTGHHGIFLEDLFVRPEARGAGVGQMLMVELAAIAERSGYPRIDWSVLTWNEPALRFYRALGAAPQDEWIGYRLSGDGLDALAGRSEQSP
jgi:GNAT superfamily N-acetyltransferase